MDPRRPLVLLFTWLAVLLASASPSLAGALPGAVHGVLDLSGWDLTTKGPVDLDGDWEFYWHRLLSPNDFRRPALPAPAYLHVPGTWNGLQVDGKPLPGEGYATYHLLIRTRPVTMAYGFYLRPPSAAYRLWANGRLVAAEGRVGTSLSESWPRDRVVVSRFDGDGRPIELVMQVSNFHHRLGGAWETLRFGPEDMVRAEQERHLGIEQLIFGTMLIMALYHLGLFALRRSDSSALFFGLFCLMFAVRDLTIGERFLTILAPNFDWELERKIDYSCVNLAAIFFSWFMASLYPLYMPRWFVRAIEAVAGGIFVLILLTPTAIFSQAKPVMDVFLLSGGLVLTWTIVRAARARLDGARIALAGMIFFFATVINDVLVTNNIYPGMEFASLGLFGFIFSQSFLLSARFSRAFGVAEELSDRLSEVNEAFGRFVPQDFLRYLDKKSVTEVQLGDQVQRTMSILFSDIRSFTTLSEAMTPEQNFKFINSYLSHMGPVIRENGGFIDKYIGDAIMALFDTGADQAVRAGIALLERLKSYNEGRKRAGYAPVQIGIGLNTGTLMLGTIGEHHRMESTVISDAVNLAARIEDATKRYGVSMLITDQTYGHLDRPEAFCIRILDRIRVKGKSEPVTIYEVFDGDPPELRQGKLRTLPFFKDAARAFHFQDYREALVLFERCHAEFDGDPVVLHYLERCRQQIPLLEEGWESLSPVEPA